MFTYFRFLKIALYIFFFIALVLPSGAFFGFNIKIISIVFLFSLFIIGFLFLHIRLTLKEIYFNILFICFLVIYYQIGWQNGYPLVEVNAEFSQIISTWLSFLFVFLFIKISKQGDSTIAFGTLFFSVLYFYIKSAIALLGFVSGEGALYYHELMFGISTPTWEIFPGFARVQYVNDLTCMLLFFTSSTYLVFINRVSIFNFQVQSVMIFFSIILSYSRLLFLFFFFLFFISLYFLERKSLLKFIVIIFVSIVCVFIYFTDFSNSIVEAITFRFADDFNHNSDLNRELQFEALINHWLSSPLFGNGIGSFNPDLLRGKEIGRYFMYEMQWLAILMKFGFISCFVFLSYLFIKFFNLAIQCRKQKVSYISYLCMFFFFIACFTNPYLFSSSSGVFLATVIIINKKIRELQ